MTRAQVRAVVVPVVVFGLLAIVPKLGVDIPVLFPGSLDSPGTLQLLALMLTFAGLALTYDLLFGFTGLMSFGHALYFAVGVYVAAVAMTKWHWGFWPSILFTCARRAPAPGRARHDQPAGHGNRFRDGHARLRAGGLGARVQEPGRADGRGGRVRRRLHEAALRLRRHLQHEEPLLACARLRGRCLRRRPLGDQLVSGEGLAGDPRERAAGRGARHAAVRLQADVVRAGVVPGHAGRDRLPDADQRSRARM